jgi:formiminotetrahydrofolate cyclodeaminase
MSSDGDTVPSTTMTLHEWLEAVGAEEPLPAGGHVAALAAAFGAALVQKAARILAASPRAVAHRALAVRSGVTARGLRDDFLRLGGEDDRAYRTLMAARRLERAGGPPSADAAEGALLTQLSLLEHAAALAALAHALAPVAGTALAADLHTARLLARAVAQAAHGNLRANAALAQADAAARAVETANALLARVENP